MTQSPQSKIILLSLARMNGTVITKSLGQIKNAVICNEFLTHFPNGYINFDDASLPEEVQRIETMISVTEELLVSNHIAIFHEMAGDFKRDQIKLLKEAGFVFILILRDPRRQFSSLRRIATDDKIRDNLEKAWKNIKEFHTEGWIDHIISSECYLSDQSYRKKIITKLCHEYNNITMATNMTKWIGQEFHDVCTITKNWNNENNLWNGPAAQSTFLHNDTTEFVDKKKLEQWEQHNLAQAMNIYSTVLLL